jgi:hypothetical protein
LIKNTWTHDRQRTPDARLTKISLPQTILQTKLKIGIYRVFNFGMMVRTCGNVGLSAVHKRRGIYTKFGSEFCASC